MSKIFSYYKDNIDRAWYDSSNIVYSECIDNPNDFKTLKVVFKNGTQYQYDKMDVNDYLLFREASSQGKELNSRIKAKNYPYSKLENADLNLLNEELMFRSDNGITIAYDSISAILTNKNDEIIYEYPFKPSDEIDNIVELIDGILKSVGTPTKIIDKTK